MSDYSDKKSICLLVLLLVFFHGNEKLQLLEKDAAVELINLKKSVTSSNCRQIGSFARCIMVWGLVFPMALVF